MTVNKTPNGRWRVRVKHAGRVVADRTFDRKGDAQAWESDQKRHLSLGDFISPKAGEESLGSAIERWLASRKGTVASKTHQNDEALLRKHVPAVLRRRPIASILPSDLDELFGRMLQDGLARSSVVRFRATLSGMFSWAVRSRLIRRSPLVNLRVPAGLSTDEKHEVYPFSLQELREVVEVISGISTAHGQVALVLGLTGLRWGELCALRVRDVQLVPRMAFLVSRSSPDGHEVRTVTKGGKPRSIPLPPEIEAIVKQLIESKKADDLVFTSPTGRPLQGNNWKRAARWAETGRGRRLHDLRHTAATLWLTNGLDSKTVQKWLGHASMTLTVDLYGHWMGNDADTAALAKFTAILGDATGTRTTNLRTASNTEKLANPGP
jgi:integrase